MGCRSNMTTITHLYRWYTFAAVRFNCSILKITYLQISEVAVERYVRVCMIHLTSSKQIFTQICTLTESSTSFILSLLWTAPSLIASDVSTTILSNSHPIAMIDASFQNKSTPNEPWPNWTNWTTCCERIAIISFIWIGHPTSILSITNPSGAHNSSYFTWYGHLYRSLIWVNTFVCSITNPGKDM
jgi:hypothetical protein